MVLLQTIRRLALVGAVLALGACSTLNTPPAPLIGYQPEAFNSTTHSRHFAAPAERTCEAARRALLSQGYVVNTAQADQVSGRKYFQPSAEHHVQLEFRVVCAAESGEPDATVAFVSGLQDQYLVRKVKESASLGVGGIGSLSLPVEGTMDSMVKVSSETVTDSVLYQRLFDLVGNYLASATAPGEHAARAPLAHPAS